MGTRIGYATVAFDGFHIENRVALRHARRHCDFLVAGISPDQSARKAQRASDSLPVTERAELARQLYFVDRVHIASTADYFDAWRAVQFTHLFVSTTTRHQRADGRLEEQFAPLGVEVLYLGTSADRYSAYFWRAVDAVADNAVAVVG